MQPQTWPQIYQAMANVCKALDQWLHKLISCSLVAFSGAWMQYWQMVGVFGKAMCDTKDMEGPGSLENEQRDDEMDIEVCLEFGEHQLQVL